MTGRIFDIQRFSIHDGPGIRTTVFFQGCPLRCLWCHNPEGMAREPMLSFVSDRCVGCGHCSEVCQNHVHRMELGVHRLDRSHCTLCGRCVEVCRGGSLEMVGRALNVEEVLGEVLSDEPFYRTSGGGMTLSGGEPLDQPDFAGALLSAAKARGLHCCLETSGFADFSRLARVMPYVDLFLYDIKGVDPARHLANTGVPNESILANLRRLHDAGAAIRLRAPLVPGYNDGDDDLAALADLARSLPRIDGLEIMPYHGLGGGKLARFGLDDRMPRPAEAPDEATTARWRQTLSRCGVDPM